MRNEKVEKQAGEALEGRQEKTGHTESCLRVARRGHTEQGWVKIEGDGGFSHWASKSAQADEMSYIFVLLPPKPQAVREGDVGTVAAWLFLMLQWWMPMCLVGPALTFLALGPRLLAPHLLGLVVLWAAVAGAVAWGTWWVKRKSSTR